MSGYPGRQPLEALVQPQVLLGHAAHLALDQVVEAQRVGHGVVGLGKSSNGGPMVTR